MLSLILKPAVLVITTILLLKFYKKRETEAGFKLFALSMLFFWLGEMACAIDVYLLSAMTSLNEGLHETGMALSFSFFFMGIWERMTRTGHCFRTNCHLYAQCRLHPATCEIFPKTKGLVPVALFGLAIIAAMALAVVPVETTGSIVAGVGDQVFGEYLYQRSPELIIFQHRILPLFSVCLLVLSGFLIAYKHRIDSISISMAGLGVGTLSFVYFRLMMIQLYNPNLLWTGLAEELLELMSVIYLLIYFSQAFTKASD